MTFKEYSELNRIVLTSKQLMVANKLLAFIKSDPELLMFFRGRGTGTTTLIKLLELYTKR